MVTIEMTRVMIPADRTLMIRPNTVTTTIETTGVRVRLLTIDSAWCPGSILSRDSEYMSRVATAMLASRQEMIATKPIALNRLPMT